MKNSSPVLRHFSGMLLLVVMAISCSKDNLPVVPEFADLGFEDALKPVRSQVLDVYDKWRKNPHDHVRNGRLGMHLSVYGKNAVAEILYRRARALAPEEFRWVYYLAVSLIEQGRFIDAAEMFREALRLSPGHMNARLHLARLLLERGDVSESRELYESLSAEYPENVEGWFGLGKVLTRMGDQEAAAAALRRALELGPQFGEVHYALAFVLRSLGDAEEAARELAEYERKARARIRTYDPLVRALSELYAGDKNHMAMASRHYGRRDYSKAADSFRAVLAINPDNMDAWPGLVSALARQGEIDAAGDAYRDALAAGISYVRLHLTYAKELLEVRRFETAREAVGQAIRLDPHSAEALAVMGDIEMQLGENLSAVEYYHRSLRAGPGDTRVQVSLAQSLNAAQRFDEAAELLEPLIGAPQVELALVYKELALAYHGMNRNEAALEALQRSLEEVLKTNNVPLELAIKRLLAEWRK